MRSRGSLRFIKKCKLTKKELKQAVKDLLRALEWVQGGLIKLDYDLTMMRGEQVEKLPKKKSPRTATRIEATK